MLATEAYYKDKINRLLAALSVVTEERDSAREEIILHKQTISNLSETVERFNRALTKANGQ